VRELVLVAVAFAAMAWELAVSWRHERALRQAGAVEPPGDVYPVMRIVYPLCFLAMGVEAWRGTGVTLAWFAAGALIFTAAKTLKMWAIHTLGPRWTFRVLVVPGRGLISSGPYRWLRHPNYLAIPGELGGVAIALGAPVAGALSLLAFACLLARRIVVEERALGLR